MNSSTSNLNSSASYKYSQNSGITSPTSNLGYGSKIGTSYTSSSAYVNQRKPALFKSSKFVSYKTEESGK